MKPDELSGQGKFCDQALLPDRRKRLTYLVNSVQIAV